MAANQTKDDLLPGYVDTTIDPELNVPHRFLGCFGTIRTGVIVMSIYFFMFGLTNLIMNIIVMSGYPLDYTPLLALIPAVIQLPFNVFGLIGAVKRSVPFVIMHALLMLGTMFILGFDIVGRSVGAAVGAYKMETLGRDLAINVWFMVCCVYAMFLSMRLARALKKPATFVNVPVPQSTVVPIASASLATAPELASIPTAPDLQPGDVKNKKAFE